MSGLVGLPQLMSGSTRRSASHELYEAGSFRRAGSAKSQIVAATTARTASTVPNGLRSRTSRWRRTCLAADTLLHRRQVRGVSGAPFEGVEPNGRGDVSDLAAMFELSSSVGRGRREGQDRRAALRA